LAVIEKPATDTIIAAGKNDGLLGTSTSITV